MVLAASQEAGAPAAPASKEKHNPNRLADSQKKLQTCARALRNRMVRSGGGGWRSGGDGDADDDADGDGDGDGDGGDWYTCYFLCLFTIVSLK